MNQPTKVLLGLAFCGLAIIGCRTTNRSATKDAGTEAALESTLPDTAVSILNPEAMDVSLDEFPDSTMAEEAEGPADAARSTVLPPCYRLEFDLNPFATHAQARQNAYWMGVVARLAYDPEEGVRAFLQRKMGMTAMIPLAARGWSYDTQGFFAELENDGVKSALLTFRGTSEKIDFFTDLRATPVPFYGIDANGIVDNSKFLGYVHKGFANALEGVWRDVYRAARSFKGKGPIFISGHSLGGALATLAAARLLTAPSDFNVRGVFTFGSPRVGGTDFSDQIALKSPPFSRIFRFVNADDAVAVVPSTPILPAMRSWHHVGELQWFNERGDLFANGAANDRATSTIWTKHLSMAWVYDHRMTNYLPKLERLIYPGRAECQ